MKQRVGTGGHPGHAAAPDECPGMASQGLLFELTQGSAV